MSSFCIYCGGYCENKSIMSTFGDKMWCKYCNHYTKTIDLVWDFESHSCIIISNYTKTDKRPTYSLDRPLRKWI